MSEPMGHVERFRAVMNFQPVDRLPRVDGILPLERQAGTDAAALRESLPELRIIGHFDKMVMSDGEQAIRAEFERILPVMRQGGFIPSVDHQTPPGVSLEHYRIYLRLLDEYTQRAGG